MHTAMAPGILEFCDSKISPVEDSELKKVKQEVKHTENPRLLRNILKVSPEMSPIASHCQPGIVALAGELTHSMFYWNASHQDHQHSTPPACTLLWVCGTQKLLRVGNPS